MRWAFAALLASALSCTVMPRAAAPIAQHIDVVRAAVASPAPLEAAEPSDDFAGDAPQLDARADAPAAVARGKRSSAPPPAPSIVPTSAPIATPTSVATPAPVATPTPVATPAPVATVPPAVTASPVAEAPSLPAFDAAMTSVLAQGYPGGSLAIIRDGKLVYARGYGSAREGVAATATTRYRQASISKAVTASLVAKLVASGTLSLGLNVFPLFGITPADPRANGITVRMLRDHTSGIRRDHFVLDLRAAATHYAVASPPDADTMLRWTARHTLATDPGSAYSYNNTNYAILSRVIEKVTGRAWIDLVREMTRPAGVLSWRMEASLAQPMDEPRYHEVERYRFMPSVFDSAPGMVEAPYGGYDAAVLGGASALVSTVIDVARYGHAVSMGTLLPPEPDAIPTRPGWLYTYVYNGSMPGHYTFLMRIWNGANLTIVAGAFNHRDAGAVDQMINERVLGAYRATTTWPAVDLFPRF